MGRWTRAVRPPKPPLPLPRPFIVQAVEQKEEVARAIATQRAALPQQASIRVADALEVGHDILLLQRANRFSSSEGAAASVKKVRIGKVSSAIFGSRGRHAGTGDGGHTWGVHLPYSESEGCHT